MINATVTALAARIIAATLFALVWLSFYCVALFFIETVYGAYQ